MFQKAFKVLYYSTMYTCKPKVYSVSHTYKYELLGHFNAQSDRVFKTGSSPFVIGFRLTFSLGSNIFLLR